MADQVRPHHLDDEVGDGGELLELLGQSRPAWHADALCREHPEVNFFPERGELADPAKRVCAGCLVSSDCRRWALDQGPMLAGIWGGLSGRERQQLRGGRTAA